MNIYHALDDDYIHGEKSELENHLLAYKKTTKKAGVKRIQTMLAEGDPGKTIISEVIPQVNPDLLIIGSFDKTGISKHFGSQAAYMAKYAPVPVLVVR